MDIDIDFKDRQKIIDLLKPTLASRIDESGVHLHNVGVYFQPIPKDPSTNRSTIDYRKAEELGYTKLDFLNLNVYENVKSNEHLSELADREPVWDLLEEKSIVQQLFHLHSETNTEICIAMQPKSIEELAIVLAIVRPGKIHLIGEPWEKIKAEIWEPTEKYYFKKAHAFSYAKVIMVQLNLIVEQLLEEESNGV